MRRLKKKFVEWLLKDNPNLVTLSVDNIVLNESSITYSSIGPTIETNGDVFVDKVKIQDGYEVIIRKK